MLDNVSETQIFSVEEQEKLDAIETDRSKALVVGQEEFELETKWTHDYYDEQRDDLIKQFNDKHKFAETKAFLLSEIAGSGYSLEEFFKEEIEEANAERERVAELEKVMRANSPKHRFIDDSGKTWDGRAALASDEWTDFVIINENGKKKLNQNKIIYAGRINPAFVSAQYSHDRIGDDLAYPSSVYFATGKKIIADPSLTYTKTFQETLIELVGIHRWCEVMQLSEKEEALMLLKYK